MNRQMRIEDFVFPFGQLDKNNEWVKLPEIVPWDEAEGLYAQQLVNNGHPAHPARIALGALIIKQKLKCSDEWTVRHVSENPYLQYFLGLKEYASKCPFGASTITAFFSIPLPLSMSSSCTCTRIVFIRLKIVLSAFHSHGSDRSFAEKHM